MPQPGERLLFINAEMTDVVTPATVVQPRYDRARYFLDKGCNVLASPPSGQEKAFDTAWFLPGKDMQETQYLLAAAVLAVRAGGLLVAAAANDAGGKRLKRFFLDLGLSPTDESKHKSRVVFAERTAAPDINKAREWLAAGAEQKVIERKFFSRPGLHSWDEIDKGTALLARCLPDDLSGFVADFGCGWGYLSLQAAVAAPRIGKLTLIDIDSRAIDIAQKNIAAHHPHIKTETIWADLAAVSVRLGPFDAVLLNPPFHEGTKSNPALGQAIIRTAARSLTPSGRLYLVANRHLPYEQTLQDFFSSVTALAEEGGFKVVCSQAKR